MFAGRYQLLERIGEGGFGVVWRCLDLDLEEPVAIKFIRDELANDRELRTSLRREVKLARRVTHPNVARVFEFGHDGDLYFLTMEFVPGETLQSLLGREGPLPRERALSLARSLCSGLAAAHEAGVIHGDIKPGNILVSPGRGAVLTDFGIARSLSEVHQANGMSVGTPIYMAHEQFTGASKSLQSDVYAVGVVLFEALTGKSPWPTNDLLALLTLKHEAREPDLRRLAPELPGAWIDLLGACMRNDPAQRPQNARSLLERLNALEGPVARIDSPTPVEPRLPPPSGPPLLSPASTPPELLRYGPLDVNTIRLYLQARAAYMADSPDALPFYEAALARAPDHPMLRLGHWMARTRAAVMFQEPHAELLATLMAEAEAAIAEFRDRGEPYLTAASLLWMSNKPVACATYLRQALARDANLPPAYAFLCEMLIDIGRLPDAERRLDIALGLNQYNPFLWQARARLRACQGRWDEFYGLAEGKLAELHFRGPEFVRLMLWNPRRDVLERLAADLAENRDGLPPPLCEDTRRIVAFLLGHGDRRAHFEHLLAEHPADRRSSMARMYAQILCEMACMLGDLDRARALLASAVDNSLMDWHWLERCPSLAPLRGEPQFAELGARVRALADAVADAIWG